MIEVLKQFFEALEECRRDPRLKYEHPTLDRAITSLRQAIKELENQEPVAWMDADGNYSDNNDYKCFPIPLYTHPPQLKWVGLTNEERARIWANSNPTAFEVYSFAKAIEAKLKEKNT